jgi:hypothetical protein
MLRSATGERCWVEPLVCFPRATVFNQRATAEPVVVGSDQLLSRLRSRSGRLSAEVCRRIADAIGAIKGSKPHHGLNGTARG